MITQEVAAAFTCGVLVGILLMLVMVIGGSDL